VELRPAARRDMPHQIRRIGIRRALSCQRQHRRRHAHMAQPAEASAL